MRLENHSDNFP